MKTIYLITFIFCSSFIYSQSALNILDFYHETFPDANARIITSNATLGDYKYHSNIGGIAFQAVASPAENISNENISLDFENNRMVVKFGNKTFYPNLPFWQLYPIVNFSNSSFSVVFSQLGSSFDNGAECRFHPAFLDNLLGVRLLQADFLNYTDILWDLPIDAQREYILAPSEQGFKPQRDSVLHRKIYEKLVSGGFSSFVLTDKDVDFTFNTDEYGIKFSGRPYYYFIKSNIDTANIRQLREKIDNYYKDIESNAKILLKEKYTSKLDPRTNLTELLEALESNKNERIFNPYAIHYIESAVKNLDSLNKLTDEEIGIDFKVLDNYSESFKTYWDALKGFNPIVYSAIENTAQWSAFFRYIRKENPPNWTIFAEKVLNEGRSNAPEVKTPTSTDINYFRYFDEREKGLR